MAQATWLWITAHVLALMFRRDKKFFSVTCDKIRTAIAIISNLQYSLQLWGKATKTPKQQKQKNQTPNQTGLLFRIDLQISNDIL